MLTADQIATHHEGCGRWEMIVGSCTQLYIVVVCTERGPPEKEDGATELTADLGRNLIGRSLTSALTKIHSTYKVPQVKRRTFIGYDIVSCKVYLPSLINR